MILRWFASNAIDPDTPISQAALKECVDEACSNVMQDDRELGIVIMFPPFAVFGIGAVLFLKSGNSLIVFYLVAVSMFVALILSVILIIRPVVKKALRMRVRAHGFDVCIKCGYYLRGLDNSEDRCPDCGWKR